MTTNDETAAGTAGSCPVCAATMAADADRCSSCGATRGEEHKCPFCGVVAQAEPHPQLRFACPACGAPRVPAVADLTPSASMTKALTTARSARSSKAVWQLAAGLSTGFGLLAVLILVGVSMIASPATFPLIVAGIVTAMPFVFALLALRNAAARTELVQQSLDEAWLQAAKSLTGARGSLRNAELAEAFGIDEDLSRNLLARLAAHSEVSTDVTDDGDLALSMRVPEERLRVAPAIRVETADEREPVEVEAGQEEADTSKKVAS